MKFRWFRNLLKGFSVTAALFVFQACYGTPQGFRAEEKSFDFEVVDTDGNAVQADIYSKNSPENEQWTYSASTNANGFSTLYIAETEVLNPVFRIEAEGFESLDTTAVENPETGSIKIVLKKAE